MAFSDSGSLGAVGNSGNNQASLLLTTTLTAAVGNLVVLVIADDNDGAGADGDGAEVTSVTNSGTANIWQKAVGWSNNQAATQAGAAVQIWFSIVTAQITSGATITATFASPTLSDATAITGRVFSLAAGMQPAIIATNASSNDAADPSALDAATPNVACLRIRGIAGEIGTSTALTPTGSWTAWASGNSATSGTIAEMCVRAEHIISTGTGASSNPTWVACDIANAYVAFVERDSRWGWESQGAQFVTQQPPPGGSNKSRASAGAFAGPDSILDEFIPPVPSAVYYEASDDFFPQAKPLIARRGGALKQKVGFSVHAQYFAMGWEVQPVQPPALIARLRRYGSHTYVRGQTFPFIIGPVQTQDYSWFESPWVYPAKRPYLYKGGIKTKAQFAAYGTWYNFTWEIQPPQPPHPRRERSGAIAAKDDGIQAVVTSPVVINWQESPWVFPKKNFADWVAIASKDDGIARPFARWLNAGWEIQGVQPPPTRQKRFGAHDTIFDIDARFVDWKNYGFDAWPTQPVHRKFERVGGLLRGLDGIDFPKISALQTVDFAWNETPWIYPRIRFERSGALADRDDGIDRPFSIWVNTGWEIQLPQPPHIRRERIAAILEGIDGIEGPYVAPPVSPPPEVAAFGIVGFVEQEF